MEDLPLADARQRALMPRLLFLAMRASPSVGLRRLVARWLAKAVGAAPQRWQRTHHALGKAAQVLAEEGVARLPKLLTSAQLREIHAYLGGHQLVTRSGQRFNLHAAPEGVGTASFPLSTVLACPHVLELVNHPEVLALAEKYLGCRPTVSGLRIDWSGPGAQERAYVQQFHRDYDDWRLVKVFVYLSDVGPLDGPHEFVKRSHLRSGRIRTGYYEERDVANRYGRHAIETLTGGAGTSFAEDTWGIHRGCPPVRGYRLLLQIQYSLLPVFKFVYRPVRRSLAPHWDPYVNRLLIVPS